MSYDIRLVDPVTKKPLHTKVNHDMRGGMYALGGTTELWLNITWNYAHYYYESTDGHPRFAHDEISAYYADGTTGPVKTEYGIRGIYGKTGAESIPMLKDNVALFTMRMAIGRKWTFTKLSAATSNTRSKQKNMTSAKATLLIIGKKRQPTRSDRRISL